MALKGKKILVTAGPTSVALDKVRVISNTASGETGLLLARELKRKGAKVTLLLGAGGGRPAEGPAGVRLQRFRYFDELRRLMRTELRRGRYDVLIHAAAVSDYRPARMLKGKFRSGQGAWRVTLLPTPKLIDEAKRIARSLRVVGFKFEPEARKELLLARARRLLRQSACELVVANTYCGRAYRAYLVREAGIGPLIKSKTMLAKELVRSL